LPGYSFEENIRTNTRRHSLEELYEYYSIITLLLTSLINTSAKL
jgi:hypothetical protein